MKVPKNIPLDKNGQYCMSCFAETVTRIFRDGHTLFECSTCGKVLERSLVIDDTVTSWISEDGTYWHESVGIIVMNPEKKVLCVLRQIFPFAYAIPAGHLDMGEKPEVAAPRELLEETGIDMPTLEHVADFDIPGDSCRRGCDDHRWHLYKCTLTEPTKVVLDDEASEAHWFSYEEMKALSPVTYPFAQILEKFGPDLFT